MNTLQSIRELTEKMRKNRSNEVNINKDVNTKLLTPNSILSPANKYIKQPLEIALFLIVSYQMII